MKSAKKIGLFIACMLLGGLVGGLSAKYGRAYMPSVDLSPAELIALLLLLPASWLLAVVMHELGHVLLGRLQSFQFHWLAVGPFMWKKQAGQVRFEWNTKLNVAGGMALCVPADEHNLRRRFMAFAAGGPVGSALWAAAALGGYALLPAAGNSFGQVLSAALAVSGVISALLVFLTLIPMHTGGFYSDGARMLNLWRGGPSGQLEAALLSAIVRSMAGVRPRELPEPQLEAAAALPQELPFKLYIYHYLYLAALDGGRTEQAALYLNEYRNRLALMPEALQGGVWLESAFFAAAYQHDLPAARAFQAQAKLTPHITADVPARTEAALARVAGDTDLARAQAQKALLELPKSLDQGSARFYAEWLEETVHWAEQPVAS